MHRAVLRGLRRNGIDVLTVHDADKRGLEDEEQLVFAAAEGRVVYSANVPDFSRLHAEWQRAGDHHAGIVVLSHQDTPIGVQIRALTRLAVTLDADTMRDRIEFLSDWIEEVP